MDTGSTASSNTDVDHPPENGDGDADSVGRRAFFRVFSRQTVTAVAQVAGVVGDVQRGTAAAVVEAVGIGLRTPADSAARLAATSDPAQAAGADQGDPADQLPSTARFASAYRLDDRGLVIIDQRVAPDRIEEIVCQRAADVAFQMRTFACNGGALLAQVAAYGLALTANEARAWPQLRREAELRRSAQLLTYARPTAHPVRVTIERLQALAKTAAGPDGTDGDAVAVALRSEADAIANEFSAACASIARSTADLLRPTDGATLRVLMLGDPGQMTSGQVGTGITAMQLLKQSGVDLQVWVAEGSPRREGARLGSWELRNGGIEHAVIGDGAMGWLFGRESIDAVVLAVDWIGPSGTSIASIGARIAVELAARDLHGNQPRVVALAPSSAISDEEFDLSRLPNPTLSLPTVDAATGVKVLRPEPQVESLPAERIGAIVTERGVHRAPFAGSLPGAR
jgi:methylthioribose-1-phosphate isomerase